MALFEELTPVLEIAVGDEEVFLGPISQKEASKFDRLSRRKTCKFVKGIHESSSELGAMLPHESETTSEENGDYRTSCLSQPPDASEIETSSTETHCAQVQYHGVPQTTWVSSQGAERYDGDARPENIITDNDRQNPDAMQYNTIQQQSSGSAFVEHEPIDFQSSPSCSNVCEGEGTGGSNLQAGVSLINTPAWCGSTAGGGTPWAGGVYHNKSSMNTLHMQVSISKTHTSALDYGITHCESNSYIRLPPSDGGMTLGVSPNIVVTRGLHKSTEASEGLVKQLDFATKSVISSGGVSSCCSSQEDGLLSTSVLGTEDELDQSLFTDEESLVNSSLRGEIKGVLQQLSSEADVTVYTEGNPKISLGSCDLNETASSVSSGPVPENITDSPEPQDTDNVEVPKPVFDLMPLASALDLPVLRVTPVELHDKNNSAFRMYPSRLPINNSRIGADKMGFEMSKECDMRATEQSQTVSDQKQVMSDLSEQCPQDCDQSELVPSYSNPGRIGSDDGSCDSGIAVGISEVPTPCSPTQNTPSSMGPRWTTSPVVFKESISPMVTVQVNIPSYTQPIECMATEEGVSLSVADPSTPTAVTANQNTPAGAPDSLQSKRRIKALYFTSCGFKRSCHQLLSEESQRTPSAISSAVPVSKENCCPRHTPLRNQDGRPPWNPSTLLSPKSRRGTYLNSTPTTTPKQGTTLTASSPAITACRRGSHRRVDSPAMGSGLLSTSSHKVVTPSRSTYTRKHPSLTMQGLDPVEEECRGTATKSNKDTDQRVKMDTRAHLKRKPEPQLTETGSSQLTPARTGKKRACSPSVHSLSGPCKRVPFAPSSTPNVPITLSSTDPVQTLIMNDWQLEAMTQLNTVCNSQQLARITKKPRVHTFLKQSPAPRESSKVQWPNDPVLQTRSPNTKCASATETFKTVKPILSVKPSGDLYPYSDRPPSPVVIRKSPTRMRENPLSRPLWQ